MVIIMYYLNKMSVEYLTHLIHIEQINLPAGENNKKKLISLLTNHYKNKYNHQLYLVM